MGTILDRIRDEENNQDVLLNREIKLGKSIKEQLEGLPKFAHINLTMKLIEDVIKGKEYELNKVK